MAAVSKRPLWHAWVVLSFVLVSFVSVVPAMGAQSDYNGTYAGTFSGDDSGYWVAVVSSDSLYSFFLSYSETHDAIDMGYVSWSDESDSIGHYGCDATALQGGQLDLYIDVSDGSVTGEWRVSGTEKSAAFLGGRITSGSYEGDFSGIYTGEADGTLSFSISDSGTVTGSFTGDSGTGTLEGACQYNGNIIMGGEDNNEDAFVFYGLSWYSTVSGVWTSEAGGEGIFSVTADGGGSYAFQGFNYQAYLAANPDLPRTWGYAECIGHYILFGFWEKRAVCFNLSEYLNANPDLPADWTFETALSHYNQCGRDENRLLAFDAQEYLSLYADLPQEWTYEQAYGHYINCGKQEGRIASFDEVTYLELYADLPDTWGQTEAFYHYIVYGINEGRVYDLYDESVFTSLIRIGS